MGSGAETWIGSLDGGEPRLLLRGDAQARYAEPGYLLFKRGPLFSQRIDPRDFHLVGEPVRLTDAVVGSNGGSTYFALTTSTTGTLAYAAAQGSDTQLTWRDRTGRALGSLPMNDAVEPALSPDGTTVAMARGPTRGSRDLWLYDVKRSIPTRWTLDSGGNHSPVWSPDGNYLTYAGTREGSFDRIYRKPISASGAEEPLFIEHSGSSPTDWSADGRFIVFHNAVIGDQRRGQDLWLLSLPDLQVKPLAQTSFNEIQGALSPDGRWIAYTSDESGIFEVYVQPFHGGGPKRLVSRGGGAEPRWRRDGRELFYISGELRLMSVAITSGAVFEARCPEILFGANVPDLAYPYSRRYDVTPDGRRFIVQEPIGRGGPSSLTVVVNWPALLPKDK